VTRLLSILFGLAPLAFGAIRVLRADDLRVLWMAVASGVVVAAVVMVRRSRTNRSSMALGRALLALLLGIVAASATGYALGARAWPGILGVAVVHSFCWVLSFVFGAVARQAARTA
jgi:1,4-dihydroxy-2-naphthoate octaprenyltransferase